MHSTYALLLLFSKLCAKELLTIEIKLIILGRTGV